MSSHKLPHSFQFHTYDYKIIIYQLCVYTCIIHADESRNVFFPSQNQLKCKSNTRMVSSATWIRSPNFTWPESEKKKKNLRKNRMFSNSSLSPFQRIWSIPPAFRLPTEPNDTNSTRKPNGPAQAERIRFACGVSITIRTILASRIFFFGFRRCVPVHGHRARLLNKYVPVAVVCSTRRLLLFV